MNNKDIKINSRGNMKSLIIIIAAIIMFLQDIIAKFGELLTLLFLGLTYVLKTVGIALAGGFADYLIAIRERHEKFSFAKALLNTFVAGFAGFLTVQLCLYFKVDASLMGFLCGISGFAGVRALKFMESITKKITETFASLRFDIKKEANITEPKTGEDDAKQRVEKKIENMVPHINDSNSL